jgi:predicted anti-sigma-YlaC factor YlaD
MSCERCDEWVQEVLDGVEPNGELIEHLVCCPACRELYESAVTLAEGARRLPRPMAPEGLTDCIVLAVRADRRRRQGHRRTWGRAAALAAAVLLALFIAGPRTPRTQESTHVAGTTNPEPPPSLRETVVTAGSAVVDRARRQMGEAVESTLSMLPSLDEAVPPMDVDPPLESTPRPLLEAGQGVTTGLEPVAGSARRAVALFLRDLSKF